MSSVRLGIVGVQPEQGPIQNGGGDGPRREHELQTFLRQDLEEIASEYARIFSRSKEDPGTAGDEGEENWAHLLRQWLPDAYKVVTKGRILGVDGLASPQVDLLVLSPSYPARLLNKKVYLVHGVAAAFECKTTLKKEHVAKAAKTSAAIRALAGARVGTPYRELSSPPTYGLLAHSHSWKGPNSSPRENVDRALEETHKQATHPRDLIDIVCVADLACWRLSKMPYMGEVYFSTDWEQYRERYGLPPEGGALTSYHRWNPESREPEPNPLAVGIAVLLQNLGWEDQSLRPLADYFRLAGIWGSSQGKMVPWALRHIYEADVADRLVGGGSVNGDVWSEWSMSLP